MRLAACAAAVLLTCPAAASGRVERTVVAGPLTATLTAEPWNVTFSDAGGRAVLRATFRAEKRARLVVAPCQD